MELMIDANILLDVLEDRKPFVKDSALIWKMCESKCVAGSVSTLTFTNIAYVMRKVFDRERLFDTLSKLSLIFTFRDFTTSDLAAAAGLYWNDYEDAVQNVIAKRIGADYILTRNKRDFELSDIPAVTPREFLELFEFGGRK